MRYGIAVWNFMAAGVTLAERVRHFADAGFTSVSFLPQQLLPLADGPAAELQNLLRERQVAATVHGNATLTRENAARIVSMLGPALEAITFDSAMTGSEPDLATNARTLADIRDATAGTSIRFGVEDVPLDAPALDRCRSQLAPFLQDPRFGILIDLGHLHLRRNRNPYYGDRTVEANITAVPLDIVEVHIHDNAGDRDSHGPIGFGTLDFAAAARGLAARRFTGVSTIEIAPTFHGRTVEESLPAAAASRAAWRQLLEPGSQP